MDERLDYLLKRLVASGPFPGISASEGHELVSLVRSLYREEQERTAYYIEAGAKEWLENQELKRQVEDLQKKLDLLGGDD